MDTKNGWNALLHKLFEVAILLKGTFGVIEILVGGFILLVNRAAVSDVLLYLVHGELLEDPTSLFANYIANLSQSLSASTESFIGGYFLIYGFIKIFLVIGLLRGKARSYQTAIALLSAFIVYMLYRFSYTHSLFLALLIATDIATVALIWYEYQFMRKPDAYAKNARGKNGV